MVLSIAARNEVPTGRAGPWTGPQAEAGGSLR